MESTPQHFPGCPHFHKVGKRTFKTVLVATVVSFVYGLSGRNPCFACIGAVFGMGGFWGEGVKHGGNRFIGTFIGGILAMPFYWLIHLSNFGIPKFVWIALGLFLVMYISQMFDAHGAIHPGAVVFFVVIDTVIPERYISYTIARIIDTGVGVAVSLAVNAVPYLWHKRSAAATEPPQINVPVLTESEFSPSSAV